MEEISVYRPLAILPHILLPLSLLLTLSLPPFRFRGVLCSVAILALVYMSWTSPFPPSTPTTQARYGLFATAWFWYLPTLHKLLFTVPEKAFWHIKQNEKGQLVEDKEEAMNLKGWEKVKWAIALLYNPRGVGWNYAINSLPPPRFQKNEKPRFLKWQLARLVVDYLLVEAGMVFVNTYSFPEILEHPRVVGRMLIGVMCTVVIKSNWEFQWALASLIEVGFGWSTPDEWPDLFGDITECTTLSYFWGTYWQQVLKHALLGISKSLNTTLHVPSHTLLGYTTTLLASFTLSAIFHGLSQYYLLPTPPPNLLLCNLTFFLLQVPAILFETYILSLFITIETVVEAAGHVHKPSSLWNRAARLAGYVWVVGWLFVTGWPFLDAYFRV